MNFSKPLTLTLGLILATSPNLASLSAFAGGAANPTTSLHSDAAAEMIGIAESPGDMTINGQSVSGKEGLWDGQVVRSNNAYAQVTLNGVGKVMLSSGSEVKLSTIATGNGEKGRRRALVASLSEGRAIFKLNSDSGAFIRSGREAFIAGKGSEFRITSTRAGALLGVMKGDVHEIGRWKIEFAHLMPKQPESAPSVKLKTNSHRYFIDPVDSSYQTSVRAKSARELKFRVSDEDSRPVRGVPVMFRLNSNEGRDTGTLGHGQTSDDGFVAVTDAEGIATVPFKAGSKPGSVSVTAVVEGASETENKVVTVTAAQDKFWTKKNAIPVFATAAAIIVAGIIVVATKGDRLPIKGSGPVQIIP